MFIMFLDLLNAVLSKKNTYRRLMTGQENFFPKKIISGNFRNINLLPIHIFSCKLQGYYRNKHFVWKRYLLYVSKNSLKAGQENL